MATRRACVTGNHLTLPDVSWLPLYLLIVRLHRAEPNPHGYNQYDAAAHVCFFAVGHAELILPRAGRRIERGRHPGAGVLRPTSHCFRIFSPSGPARVARAAELRYRSVP